MVVISESIITQITGTGVPKTKDNQNTDDIVPAKFLKEITFKEMGNYAYFDERFDKDGRPQMSHPFNDERYRGASILVVGANYGCGSSREHAPQALKRYGIKAIIGESFAEIFDRNCTTIGIVGVTVSKEYVRMLEEYIQQNPNAKINIDLQEKTIKYGENVIIFDMSEARRQSFLSGTWNALKVLQQNQEGINKVVDSLEYLQFE